MNNRAIVGRARRGVMTHRVALCPPSRRIPHISALRCLMPTHPPAEAGGCAPLARRPSVGTSIFPTAYRAMTRRVIVVRATPRNASISRHNHPRHCAQCPPNRTRDPVRRGSRSIRRFLLLFIDHMNKYAHRRYITIAQSSDVRVALSCGVALLLCIPS